MSWQDHVARQQAAQLSADALGRVARGERFEDVVREGPRSLPRSHDEVQLLDGRPQQALPAPEERPKKRRGHVDPRMIEAFCREASDVLGLSGHAVTPQLFFRIMQQLASEGWVIDVDR